MHTVKAPSVILQARLLSRLLSSVMTNPLVLVLWCSGAQQSQAAIVTIWNLLGEQKPKAQQKTNQKHAFCLSFFSFLGDVKKAVTHLLTLNKWYPHILMWVYLMHTITDLRTPLFKILLFFTGNMHVITSPGWLTLS